MDKWTNERTNEQTSERTNERTNEHMNEWMRSSTILPSHEGSPQYLIIMFKHYV